MTPPPFIRLIKKQTFFFGMTSLTSSLRNERQKSPIEKRKRNLKKYSPISRRERERDFISQGSRGEREIF